MVWEPFALAVVFGLVVSAGLYFIVMWPQVEPDDDDDPPVDEVPADRGADAPVPVPAAADSPPAADVPATTADAASPPGTED